MECATLIISEIIIIFEGASYLGGLRPPKPPPNFSYGLHLYISTLV